LTRSRCALLTAVLSFGASGLAVSPAAAQITPEIVNGLPDLAEPTSAGLVLGDEDTGYLTCSAVLVGCDVAISAAHCFNQPANKTLLYFQHAGFVEIESATRHPAYVAGLPPTYDADALRLEDISFIKLAEPVSGITPSTLIAGQTAPPATPGHLVAFGRDPVTQASPAVADQNPGIKRSGEMEIIACIEPLLVGQDVLCWEPTDPLGDPGEEVSTCEGDSGGPMFVDEAGTRVVAGVHKGRVTDSSGGQSDLCLPPVHPYDTNVFRHLGWLHGGTGTGGMVAQTGAFDLASKTCTALPQLDEQVLSGDLFGACDPTPWQGGGDPPRTCGFQGNLAQSAQATPSFPVPDGTTRLRVAFNGIASPTGAVDTNFYVRFGAPATPLLNDCAADGAGNLGFCEWTDPQSGTWHLLVDQVADDGEYQAVVTLFGPAPPPPPVQVPALGPAGGGLLVLLLAATPWWLRRRAQAPGSR